MLHLQSNNKIPCSPMQSDHFIVVIRKPKVNGIPLSEQAKEHSERFVKSNFCPVMHVWRFTLLNFFERQSGCACCLFLCGGPTHTMQKYTLNISVVVGSLIPSSFSVCVCVFFSFVLLLLLLLLLFITIALSLHPPTSPHHHTMNQSTSAGIATA